MLARSDSATRSCSALRRWGMCAPVAARASAAAAMCWCMLWSVVWSTNLTYLMGRGNGGAGGWTVQQCGQQSECGGFHENADQGLGGGLKAVFDESEDSDGAGGDESGQGARG